MDLLTKCCVDGVESSLFCSACSGIVSCDVFGASAVAAVAAVVSAVGRSI